MSDYTVYQLARMADTASPDSPDSPGAKWLAYVELCAEDVTDEDGITEAADQAVPVYTYEMWQTFVDLAAWQEDITEFGPVEEMEKGAQVALYMIADSLIHALVEDRADDSEDDDES